MAILMVLTSDSGRPDGPGLRAPEFAGAYYQFRDAGQDVLLSSPGGALPSIGRLGDWDERQWPAIERLRRDISARSALADTVALADVYPAEFDAAYYPGGPGAAFDLPRDPSSWRLIRVLLGAGAPVAFVSEAVAALLGACLGERTPLVSGRNLTCPAGEAVDVAMQPAMSAQFSGLGAIVTVRPVGTLHVVRDGALITAQNPRSAVAGAAALLSALAET